MDEVNEDLVCIREMSAKDVLALNLAIPQYQRAYIWQQGVVKSFVSDIEKWITKNPGSTKRYYHLGCIILKRGKGVSGEDEYAIVDGQQRLITLALWARHLGLDDKRNALIGKTVRGGEDAIKRARDICKGFSMSLEDFSRLELSVLEIAEQADESLAYAFFDNTNTLGKRLSDYDLLKTHHLRFLRDEVDNGRASRFCAQKWNLLATQNIGDESFQKVLLNDCLYRIRQWSWTGGVATFPVNGDSFFRTLYKHFSSKVDDHTSSLFETKSAQEAEKMIVGGMPFFEYVEYFRARYVQFLKHPAVACLHDHLAGHSKGVVYKAVLATSFIAYCRFGDWYLSDMICALAYAISRIRCRDSVQERMLTWCSDGREEIVGGWGGYMNRVTKAVLHAPSDAALVELLHGDDFRYVASKEERCNTKYWYWTALKDFLHNCPDRQECSDYYDGLIEI